MLFFVTNLCLNHPLMLVLKNYFIIKAELVFDGLFFFYSSGGGGKIESTFLPNSSLLSFVLREPLM
jgi:hypothetical protein